MALSSDNLDVFKNIPTLLSSERKMFFVFRQKQIIMWCVRLKVLSAFQSIMFYWNASESFEASWTLIYDKLIQFYICIYKCNQKRQYSSGGCEPCFICIIAMRRVSIFVETIVNVKRYVATKSIATLLHRKWDKAWMSKIRCETVINSGSYSTYIIREKRIVTIVWKSFLYISFKIYMLHKVPLELTSQLSYLMVNAKGAHFSFAFMYLLCYISIHYHRKNKQ